MRNGTRGATNWTTPSPVDLQSSRFINKVVVRNRTDCCSDRLNNFKLLVSEDGSTWQAYSYPNVAPQQTEFPVGRTGRFVKVQLDGSGVLSLAEVKVL
ncbi:MAG TPA: discoidin domain-containing protein [Archangium sp.]|uniref:discoidin domain-containing protein n=1 Tax=Archangium sp. TaxID=1872627 RepID=UPI002E33E2EB|nr:discoidin domain-containing protein [Archangium sp.]HEX5749269.1 discoidin domain-containing protein [Archangium sp.]